jgi:hypothetical protein
MNRKTLVAGLVASSLLVAGLAGGVGTASAATPSVLSVTPVEPKVADVCWTEYVPDSGTVTGYKLTSSAVGGGIAVPADQLCVRFDQLLSGKPYAYDLEVQIDGGAYVKAAETVNAKPYVLTVSVRPVVNCCKVTVSGTLKSNNKGIGSATIIIQKRATSTDPWVQAATVSTNAKGSYRKAIPVNRNIKVRTYFKGLVGGPQTVGAWNSDNPVDVRPVFTLDFSKNPARRGQTVRATGVVKAGTVAVLAGDPICIQQQKGRSWKSLKCVSISAKGRFSAPVTADKTGKDLKYRWRATSVAPEYVAGNSRTVVLKVR